MCGRGVACGHAGICVPRPIGRSASALARMPNVAISGSTNTLVDVFYSIIWNFIRIEYFSDSSFEA